MGAARGRSLNGRIRGAVMGALLGALLGLGTVAAGAQSAPEAGTVGAGAPYPAVTAGVVPVFPRDHGAHPEFRTEWWYITGWLADDAGVERGFQLTFFRVRPRIAEGGRSRFNPTQLVLAHAAIADPAHGRLLHAERAERLLPPLVSADTAHTAVHVHDWSLVWVGEGGAPAEAGKGGEMRARDERGGGPGDSGGHYRARIQSGEFAYDLQISPTGEPVLNGIGGYSQKAPGPEHASYYYSRPQLEVVGSLSLKGASHAVRGTAWLDHEWSSEILPPGARGWDWIGINLHDGSSLMAFRMRGADDSAIWAAATLRTADGRIRVFRPEEIRFIARRQWRSPRSGATYPVEWSLQLAPEGGEPGRSLSISPLMDDQELDSRRSTGAIYWEGAVRLYEGEQGDEREIGKGYLEMTGYAERLQM